MTDQQQQLQANRIVARVRRLRGVLILSAEASPPRFRNGIPASIRRWITNG